MSIRVKLEKSDWIPFSFSRAFVHRVEERLILYDRPAESGAKVVPLVLRHTPACVLERRIERISRVQVRIPQVFERVSMEPVGPALAHQDGLAAHRRTIFGAEVIRDHPVFTDAIPAA